MKINRFINLSKLVRRVWFILWAILGILLIMKYCFNIWYPIIVENQTMIKMSNFIDNHTPFKLTIASILYSFSSILMIKIATIKIKLNIKTTIIIIVISILIVIIKWFNQIIGYIPEAIVLIGFPIFYNCKNHIFNKTYKNILFPILVNLLLFIWQMNVLLIRGINEIISYIPIIISLMLQIDYYIFLSISYIGVCKMGIFGPWLWGKETTELEAMKAEELKKDNPDTELIKQIDAELDKRNGK